MAIGALGIAQAYEEVYGWDEVSSVYKRLGQSLYNDEDSHDGFGRAVALVGNGRVLAVGAPDSDRNGAYSGRVDVFDAEL